ncbi:cytochrome c oxidase subunit 3 [Mesorhizobium sp. LHD-90]|uniref:cytochrome c oxidase subunit 3 n=1 Tax=Mesorhizobium sp. LHD-90 TaxID=3071414 RepID=UPI0027E107BA|nr:cytochrome c oxidase subunit 3 [Mesorhizobium sp. LHD-90]MDQ6435235.1 cytochrome c oxidase subunit 3 [Mesorhizobium sp. LHD-90]
MSVVIVFILVIAGISFWWLAQQRLMSKPWLEPGAAGVLPGLESTGIPTAKLGLGVFLAVVGCLFALFASAYFMRMELSDWRAPPIPGVLWLNTAILILSSVALHVAVVAARRGQREMLRLALVTGGLTALAFLAGQLTAWRTLADGGYFLAGNPATSFFYLLTGMHALHIVGGLVALGWTTAGAWREGASARLGQRVELCAMYWHFLLLVWLALLVLLAGWANDFIDLCRQLLT